MAKTQKIGGGAGAASVEDKDSATKDLVCEMLQYVSEVLGLSSDNVVEQVSTTEEYKESKGGDITDTWTSFRLRLSKGAIVDLGPAKHVISFTRVREAFAEAIGHVVMSKKRAEWEEAAQVLFRAERLSE